MEEDRAVPTLPPGTGPGDLEKPGRPSPHCGSSCGLSGGSHAALQEGDLCSPRPASPKPHALPKPEWGTDPTSFPRMPPSWVSR